MSELAAVIDARLKRERGEQLTPDEHVTLDRDDAEILRRELRPIAKRMQKSRHETVRGTGRALAHVLDRKPLNTTDLSPAIVEAHVSGLVRAIAFHKPHAAFGVVAALVAPSAPDYFADWNRYALARDAFDAGQRNRPKWKAKRQARHAADRQANRDRAIDAFNALMRGK